jgi:hypothetical protein
MMNILPDHDFDPFSEESLDSVETIAFLPDSMAFENVMYDYRINRTSLYEYSHKKDDIEDSNPLIIDAKLMQSSFPDDLKGAFPDVEYVIEQLQIIQTETSESYGTSVSFLANGTHHTASIENGSATYRTYNQHLEPVQYEIEPDAVTALVASMLYAKQYDPTEHTQAKVSLVESYIHTDRNPQIALMERLILTLGNFCGSSEVKTQSIFDNPSSEPIVATLTSREYPDKSSVTNTLALNEIGVIEDNLMSIETTMFQNVVNIEESTRFIQAGKHSNRYAEQRSVAISEHGIPIPKSELIDPDAQYLEWAQTCVSFMNLIRIPMSVYIELDDRLI